MKWCCHKRQGWIPVEAVEGVGRRSEGKEQLRIDEARNERSRPERRIALMVRC